jgi:membrane protein DedA with SNARE-associated domain
MAIIESIVQIILDIIAQIGYLGIVILMAFESMGIPIPSEVVMPAGGWLASDGVMNLILVTIAGTIGCTIGSVIGYWIGLKGGRPAVRRYGKYVFLNESHLDSTERWFNRYGAVTIFLTRLLPIIRTYISFPAGIAKMRFWPFVILSAIGSLIWCFLLAYIGYLLGPNWESISGAYNTFAVIVLVGLGLAFLIYYLRRRKRRQIATP